MLEVRRVVAPKAGGYWLTCNMKETFLGVENIVCIYQGVSYIDRYTCKYSSTCKFSISTLYSIHAVSQKVF